MLTYIYWRLRVWLRYDHLCLTPEMKARMKSVSLGFRIASWVGVGLIFFGGFIYVREEERERYAQRAPGKIVRVEEKESEKPILEYQLVYQYRLPGGKMYQGSPGYWSSSFAYRAGDDVTVLYWETKPEDGTIKGISFKLAATLALSGLMFAIGFRITSKLAMNETLARIQWCLLLKLP